MTSNADIKELNINPQAIGLTVNFLPIHYNCRQAGNVSHKESTWVVESALSLEDLISPV